MDFRVGDLVLYSNGITSDIALVLADDPYFIGRYYYIIDCRSRVRHVCLNGVDTLLNR